MNINLKCKDFDAWVSFLGRLNKIGSKFIIKNDIIVPTVKQKKSGDKIPGRHLTKDPLFINDEDAFVIDGIYVMVYEIDDLLSYFKDIKENRKGARKEIIYSRRLDGIYIKFYGMNELKIYELLTEEYASSNNESYNKAIDVGSSITWFNDYLETPNDWYYVDINDIIDLRNDCLKILRQVINDKKLWIRVARSVFIMAGVTRYGVPFAESMKYTFIYSENVQKDTALCRLKCDYKAPGSSKLITVECIHEYAVLIYDEGDE